MRLRQLGITSIKDVRIATLEPNGQLGYELIPDAKPLTVGEFKKLMKLTLDQQKNIEHKIFDEILYKDQQANKDIN